MAAFHQGANRHTFLEEDDDGGLTHVQVDLELLISCVTTGDQPMGTPLGPERIYLSSDGWLSKEALNNTHPQRASALLIQAIGSDNPVQCQKCTSNRGTGSDQLSHKHIGG